MSNGSPVGKVVSIHLHAPKSGAPLKSVTTARAEAEKGLSGDARFFGRKNRQGKASRRQVSLITREQIGEHAATLGLPEIAPGVVRSNIETTGIDLISLIGQEVRVGGAVMLLYEPRIPCWKMDLIAPGLKELMGDSRQGVMAQVIRSGEIHVGDEIIPGAPLQNNP